jgi:RND superfamily putative drug exporter
MLTAGVGFLTQFGLTVAVGILLAAVMATFLVPGPTALVGRTAWWPGIRATNPSPAPGTVLSAARPES